MAQCPAGHRLPCAICGAANVSQCNGGEYVSPYLRTAPRTEQQARLDLDRAADKTNPTN